MSLSTHVVVVNNGEVLLIQREDLKVWALPGGHVEAGESVAQAAVCEVFEETGIEVALSGLVGIYVMPHWIGADYNIVFIARPVGGILRSQPGEVDDVGYFPAYGLPERLLWWHRQPIHDALAGVGGSVVWQQDVRWPTDWISPREAFALRDRGELPETVIQESWEMWCREPKPGEQWKEVQGVGSDMSC